MPASSRVLPALIAAAFVTAARADTAFNTFNPTTQDYDLNVFYPLGQLWTQGDLAWPFVAAAGGQVTHFRTATYTTTPIGSPPAPILFSIYADANGQPGPLLGQWTGGAPATGTHFPQHPDPWDMDVAGGPTLVAGQSYFFGMGLPAPTPGWFGSSPNDAGLPDVIAWRLSSGSWTAVPPAENYAAFTITVPAPSAALLSLPLLLAFRRRRPDRSRGDLPR